MNCFCNQGVPSSNKCSAKASKSSQSLQSSPQQYQMISQVSSLAALQPNTLHTSSCGCGPSGASAFQAKMPSFQAQFQSTSAPQMNGRETFAMPNTYLFTSAGPKYGATMGSVGSFVNGVQSNVVQTVGSFV